MAALSAVIATLIVVIFIGVVVLSIIEYKRSKEHINVVLRRTNKKRK